jgi:SP family sugar:H+ symporter-like MFS transporter
MFSDKTKSFSLREIGIMKPVGSPGSSLTAIGVGLYVAFGGVLFGYISLSSWCFNLSF